VGKIDRATGRWAGASQEIRWVARLGSECYTTPVVSGSRVFCATNNDGAYLARYPAAVDLGVLLCFDRAEGRFLWQHSAEKLKTGKNVDWPKVGICASPLVENDRLWIVTNRGEVACLDTRGAAAGESKVIWTFDMPRQLGIVQRYMANCSVTAAGDLLLVCTSNGRDVNDRLPAPQAPSFIALKKQSGKLVWADNSPGENILDGQWSSPAFAELGGVRQAIFAGGDGWLYAFEATATSGRKPKPLWRFDCNPKPSVWEGGGSGDRNTIVSTPVIHGGRVYVATGQDPESGEGPGDLWCIDPTKRGDTSADLVVDRDGKPVPPRRRQAVDAGAGEKVLPNPNSAAVWHYRGSGADGKKRAPGYHEGTTSGSGVNAEFQGVFHRSLGSPAIKDDVLVIGDYTGLLHCLEAKTGRACWTCDMQSAVWGSPLIADGKIYLGNEDGDVVVFEFGTKLKVLAKNNMAGSVHSTPVAAGGVLYISTATHLFAIAAADR
jgi:outer membrane protein assembly factor BamB